MPFALFDRGAPQSVVPMLLGSFGWINFEQLRSDPKVFLLELQSSLDGHVVADRGSALWHSLAEETLKALTSPMTRVPTCLH